MKTREELEMDNENLIRVLTKRKDAGAVATIAELTTRLSVLQTELTQVRADNERLRGQKSDLQALLAKTGDDADDAKDALDKLTRKKK